ncbi:MAG: TIGR02300 family protein [Rhodobacteraceae bacterium]|nr:TIGR02300 family protein [Paracoccaceae bacterium]
MPKDEWGVKRLCPQCASRFYDLRHDPMTCPECGHSFSLESLTSGRGRTLIAEKAPPQARASQVDDLDADTDIDEDSADVDLDDDLLEDDEDDNVSLDEIADVASSDEES